MLKNENSIEVKEEKRGDNSSLFTVNRIPKDSGKILGISVRKAVLCLLKRYALCGIKVETRGENESFIKHIILISSLPGVRETLPVLVSNLKKIICEVSEDENGKKNTDSEFITLDLEVDNTKNEEVEITTANFREDPLLKIKKPDFYLARLSPFSGLRIKLYYRKDRGYLESKDQEKFFSKLEEREDIIVLDTDYSPKKVLVGYGEEIGDKVAVDIEKNREKLGISVKTPMFHTPPSKVFLDALNSLLDFFMEVKDSYISFTKQEKDEEWEVVEHEKNENESDEDFENSESEGV